MMDHFWLKFILFIAGYGLLIFLFNKGMRKFQMIFSFLCFFPINETFTSFKRM